MSDRDPNVTLSLDTLIAQRQQVQAAIGSAPGNGPWPGPYQGQRHGQGLDFDELRLYMPGDDTRHIDWKVTARRNLTYTRLYREEKERLLTIALDFRSSMFTGSQTLRAVIAGKLAAGLAWHAAQLGNRCNLLIQTDTRLIQLPPATGTNSALKACKTIADAFLEARSQLDFDSHYDNDPLLDQLLSNGRFTGSVIFISGGDEPGHAFDQLLSTLSQSAKLAWILIEDEMEWQALPAGQYGYHHHGKNQVIDMNNDRAQQLLLLLQKYKTTFFERLKRVGVKALSTRDGNKHIFRHLYQWQFLA